MKESIRSLLFLTVLALVVGNGLAAINILLREDIARSEQMLRVRSLLSVLDVAHITDRTDRELLYIYDGKVVEYEGEPSIYVYRENGLDVAFAFDVVGRGLWDKINGFMAVENDGLTIRNITFYEQKETAGLGGEIGTVDFAKRFKGKKLQDAGELLHIVKAGSIAHLSGTQVDGITGATLTCDAVNRFLAPAIEAFVARKEQIK